MKSFIQTAAVLFILVAPGDLFSNPLAIMEHQTIFMGKTVTSKGSVKTYDGKDTVVVISNSGEIYFGRIPIGKIDFAVYPQPDFVLISMSSVTDHLTGSIEIYGGICGERDFTKPYTVSANVREEILVPIRQVSSSNGYVDLYMKIKGVKNAPVKIYSILPVPKGRIFLQENNFTMGTLDSFSLTIPKYLKLKSFQYRLHPNSPWESLQILPDLKSDYFPWLPPTTPISTYSGLARIACCLKSYSIDTLVQEAEAPFSVSKPGTLPMTKKLTILDADTMSDGLKNKIIKDQVDMKDSTWFRLPRVDFAESTTVEVSGDLGSYNRKGVILLYLDSMNSQPFASIKVGDNWFYYVGNFTGIHDLYVVADLPESAQARFIYLTFKLSPNGGPTAIRHSPCVKSESGRIKAGNGYVVIPVSLTKPENINLNIYSTDGSLVRTVTNGIFSAGSSNLIWDLGTDSGRKVSSGTYVISLRAGVENKTWTVSVQR